MTKCEERSERIRKERFGPREGARGRSRKASRKKAQKAWSSAAATKAPGLGKAKGVTRRRGDSQRRGESILQLGRVFQLLEAPLRRCESLRRRVTLFAFAVNRVPGKSPRPGYLRMIYFSFRIISSSSW
jgi:hypothetical protein